MPKTESKKKPGGHAAKEEAPSKKRKSQGLDEIDSLFSNKKKQDRQEKQKETERKADAKKRRSSQISSSSASSSSGGRGNKSVLETTFAAGSTSYAKWVDDGLGGKFNREGYTGRVEEGVKVFKAHVLNKPGFGQSKDCPFDCDCCFI
ncbi:MAG: hypothetical protein SGILL_000176 [Bacillariaceae sp.]